MSGEAASHEARLNMLRVVNTVILIYLLAPIIVVVATAFGTSPYPVFPPVGLTLKWFDRFLSNPDLVRSTELSAALSFVSTLCATTIGTLAALALVRHRFRAKVVISALLLSPILFPTIVLGLALLVAFTRIGLAQTFAGLVAAHTVLITPFVIRLVMASLADLDGSIEEAARNLGSGRLRTFFLITLPIIRPGLLAGALFGFIISFDELVVTLFLAGPGLQTLPIRIFSSIEYSSDPTISAISSCLIATWIIFGVPVYMRFLAVQRA
ncbi:ABC transporter permease [Acidisphaera sp. S103]|uniref:ABC transporter permease n=1 Tax=Acidisphaera sp. S103 TaxID=1747223 RepID=UPI001C2056E8|nr:ABC transporter permease [Acidisphaera sp. S103]